MVARVRSGSVLTIVRGIGLLASHVRLSTHERAQTLTLTGTGASVVAEEKTGKPSPRVGLHNKRVSDLHQCRTSRELSRGGVVHQARQPGTNRLQHKGVEHVVAALGQLRVPAVQAPESTHHTQPAYARKRQRLRGSRMRDGRAIQGQVCNTAFDGAIPSEIRNTLLDVCTASVKTQHNTSSPCVWVEQLPAAV